jgi:GNAT superfamily N-acetyltransferase
VIQTLATGLTLRDGGRMTVRLVEPPQPDYARRLCHFLAHKDDSPLRAIRQRLEGRYAQHCIDRYFVGEIDGRIVGQAWYGLPRAGTGVGNFGHVYTEPEFRGRGVATHLVRLLAEDFACSDGVCLLCGAGRESLPIYRRVGFQTIEPGAEHGPTVLLNPSAAGSFEELEQRYYLPGLAVQVRPGHAGDRHDCDRMLDFSPAARALRRRWRAVFIAARVPTFMDALFGVEDGRGLVTVLANAEGRIMGWAFALTLGSEAEEGLKTLDLFVHPNYLADAPLLAARTAERAEGAYAFAAACDGEKVAALARAGFREEYRFRGAMRLPAGQDSDVLVLRRGAEATG